MPVQWGPGVVDRVRFREMYWCSNLVGLQRDVMVRHARVRVSPALDVCVVSSLAACVAPQLGGCFLAPRTVWLACVGRLIFLVRVCL